MSTKQHSREELLAILKIFKEHYGVQYRLQSLGIFGSYARGDATADSDIDIVFETDAPNLFRTVRLKRNLESLLARPVDIVRLRVNMNPTLRNRILREARYV